MPKDVFQIRRAAEVTTAGRAAGFARPRACPVIRALPTRDIPLGTGNRDAVQPPPDSKLCFATSVTLLPLLGERLTREARGAKEPPAGTHRLVSPERRSRCGLLPVMGIARWPISPGSTSSSPVVTSADRIQGGHGVAGQGTRSGGGQSAGVREHRGVRPSDRPCRSSTARNDLRSGHPLVESASCRDDGSEYHPDAPILWIEGRGCSPNPRWVSLRDGPHRIHAAPADRNRMFHRHVQRTGFRQSPARGDQPRDRET
jgi:hypothetical protein